jgi:hypothetical protein
MSEFGKSSAAFNRNADQDVKTAAQMGFQA